MDQWCHDEFAEIRASRRDDPIACRLMEWIIVNDRVNWFNQLPVETNQYPPPLTTRKLSRAAWFSQSSVVQAIDRPILCQIIDYMNGMTLEDMRFHCLATSTYDYLIHQRGTVFNSLVDAFKEMLPLISSKYVAPV